MVNLRSDTDDYTQFVRCDHARVLRDLARIISDLEDYPAPLKRPCSRDRSCFLRREDGHRLTRARRHPLECTGSRAPQPLLPPGEALYGPGLFPHPNAPEPRSINSSSCLARWRRPHTAAPSTPSTPWCSDNRPMLRTTRQSFHTIGQMWFDGQVAPERPHRGAMVRQSSPRGGPVGPQQVPTVH